MKSNSAVAILAASVGIALFSGCASTPKQTTAFTKEQILQQEDVKKKTPVIYAKPLEEVRQAGLRSLTFVGCELQKQEPLYLAGKRPNKFGLFVGSGGETVKIFLYPKDTAETHVWVDTDLSFVGIAGQQDWNDKVLAEMKNLLETPAKTQ